MSTIQNVKPTLPLYEWIVVLSVLLLLAVLTTISLSFDHSQERLGEPHYLISQTVEVTIHGAVKKPGTYTVKRGTTLEQVFQLAELQDNADVKRLKSSRKVRKDEVIMVKEQSLKQTRRK